MHFARLKKVIDGICIWLKLADIGGREHESTVIKYTTNERKALKIKNVIELWDGRRKDEGRAMRIREIEKERRKPDTPRLWNVDYDFIVCVCLNQINEKYLKQQCYLTINPFALYTLYILRLMCFKKLLESNITSRYLRDDSDYNIIPCKL